MTKKYIFNEIAAGAHTKSPQNKQFDWSSFKGKQSDWTNFLEEYKIEVIIFATEAAPITF